MSLKFSEDGGILLKNVCDCLCGLPGDLIAYQVAFSPNGKLLAAACSDKTVRLIDPANGTLLAETKEHTDFVYSVQFSPDDKSLLSVGRDSVKVWSVAELLKKKPR